MRSLSLVAALALIASPLSAAVLQTDSSGVLTGASGVSVNGSLYDVSFADGTCASIFGTCDTAHFDFQTADTALAAAQALITQVYVGRYDTDVQHIFGCGQNASFCDTLIPFESHVTTFNFAASHNWFTTTDAAPNTYAYYEDWANVYPVVAGGQQITYDSTGPYENVVNFARFTPSGVASAVPEPSSWAMMLLGFAAAGVAMRRSRRSKALFAQAIV